MLLTVQQLDRQLCKGLEVQLFKTLPKLIFHTQRTPIGVGLVVRTSIENVRAVCLYIRNSTQFQCRTLADIAVVDYLLPHGRFSVNYLFLSMITNRRLTVQVFANETSVLPSLAAPFANGRRIFAGAAWLEREAWDMFGLYFGEHSDLRRILTDYGFSGHPLRKDFPLTGFYELVYNDSVGRVVSTPIELAQEFRVFHI